VSQPTEDSQRLAADLFSNFTLPGISEARIMKTAQVLDELEPEVARRVVNVLGNEAKVPPSTADIRACARGVMDSIRAGKGRPERQPPAPLPPAARELFRAFAERHGTDLGAARARLQAARTPEERERATRLVLRLQMEEEEPDDDGPVPISRGGQPSVLVTDPTAVCPGIGKPYVVRKGQRFCPGCGCSEEEGCHPSRAMAPAEREEVISR
jgi:hypothetical protein